MKEIKPKPLNKTLGNTVENIPKAALHKAVKTINNTVKEKMKTKDSLDTSQEQSLGANASDTMVHGVHTGVEKTTHIIVSTAKKAKNFAKKMHGFSHTAYAPYDSVENTNTNTSIAKTQKDQEAQMSDIKIRAKTTVKTREAGTTKIKCANTSTTVNQKAALPNHVKKTAATNNKNYEMQRSSIKSHSLSQTASMPQSSFNATLNENSSALQKPRLRQIKTRTASTAKTVSHTVRTNASKMRQISGTVNKAKQTQAAIKLAQKTAQQAAHITKITVGKSAQAAKVVAKAIVSAVKACMAAMQGLFAALVAFGGTAFAIIVLICLFAMIACSALGIFFAAEPNGYGIKIQEAMSTLNEEYYNQISKIKTEIPHEHLEIKSSDGVMGIRWEDVLSIYAAKITGSENATEAVTIDNEKLNILRTVLVDMNSVTYKTRLDNTEITVPVLDKDGKPVYDNKGNPKTKIEIITETTLIIELQHKTPTQMAWEYVFNDMQNKELALLEGAQYATLWAKLLGGLTMNGSGEIITPDTDWQGTDIFAWPLPQSFSISSRYGYRKDPFTGKISYHSGTDIVAPYGTPILATASGIATAANATDPWGFSYGYHVKLNHGDGKETLYAHCSNICVTQGQEVKQGEVIGFVGSTGNSTGNHLHFEVHVNGTAVDGLSFFLA